MQGRWTSMVFTSRVDAVHGGQTGRGMGGGDDDGEEWW
jgi:hypothetical protein